MSLTEVNTEKILNGPSNVQIGYDATHGIDIKTGVNLFAYRRVHDGVPAHVANTKASSDAFQPHSHYNWRLELVSDCRAAFFATDVQVAGGNQFPLDPDGDSPEIEYFRVIVPITKSDGSSGTRTYTITGGRCFTNSADMEKGVPALFVYEGIAKEITYSDA